jgi:hypothetical protein
MPGNDVEPLETSVWLGQWASLAEVTIDDDEGFERAIRRAYYLVQLAPRPLRHSVRCDVGEDVFEALLEAGSFEIAVLELVGNKVGLADVEEFADPSAEGPPASGAEERRLIERLEARRLFERWVSYLSALAETRANRSIKDLLPGQRKHQSELHPRSIRH